MAFNDILGKGLLKLFSSSSQRYVKKRREFVNQINGLESEYGQLTDTELRAKTADFKARIQDQLGAILDRPLREIIREFPGLPQEARLPAKKRLIEQLRHSCDAILPEAFAAVREASDRHLGVRNVFSKEYQFDTSILSAPMKTVFDDVTRRMKEGENVHQIELPPQFYQEVRAAWPVEKRPPYRFRHFDVQLIGGRVLYEGQIAEMATGEGKTLVATLATFIVALSGRKVHVVTVNDYLAQRDRDWMAPVYEALGLTVGAIQSAMDTVGDVRRAQYSCDITYGTNNEFGFDYLRDNMKSEFAHQVQGPLDFAIVDEVDSILIDEARTPLIISGPAQDDVSRYKKADTIARELLRKQKPYTDTQNQIDQLKRQVASLEGDLADARRNKDTDKIAKVERQIDSCENQQAELEDKLLGITQLYEVEYDRRSVHLTHEGIGAAQDIAGIGSFYVGKNMEWPHLMEQALRAHVVFEKEKDYVVQDNEVIIVDEFTGRLMQGRQWSDGLHQAVEAKENVKIKQESQTLATITLQNFFKMYQQLSGMTGTAITEEEEFVKIYSLPVVAIPTNKPIVRDDRDDLVYKSLPEKFNAILDEIYQVSKSGRPVLIGTISIEKNEALSAALTKRHNLDHEVLNAKQHAREAAIIAKAGCQHTRRDGSVWGNVTIATNMAGRGTDIKLGQGVREMGGLHVLGTERHEARRIDNQLRGRCGRQGDPGSSQFFLSFDDDLMRIFMPEWSINALKKIGGDDGEPIVHRSISKGVERAQKKVEQRNYEARKSLLEYDEVMDFQRQVFYTRRQLVLEGRKLTGALWEMIDDSIVENCNKMLNSDYPYECAMEWAKSTLGVDLDLQRVRNEKVDGLERIIRDHARNNADQDITITLGEYMADDVAKENWDLRAMAKWAMSRYGVNISQSQIREMSFEDVRKLLVDSACERIDKVDCSRLTAFLDDTFALKSLTDWINQKFLLAVQVDEIKDKPRQEVEDYLMQKARAAYHKRELEYPVDYALSLSIHRQQTAGAYAAAELANWVKHKFDIELPISQLQESSYDDTRQMLIDMSEDYHREKLACEIDGKIRDYGTDESGLTRLQQWAKERFEIELHDHDLNPEMVRDTLLHQARQFLRNELNDLERYVMLQIYDATWKDHLYSMDHLKGSIGLRSMAEKDPKIEYKREGFRMFEEMLSNIRDKVTDIIFKAKLGAEEERRSIWNISSTDHGVFSQFTAQQEAAQAPMGENKAVTIRMETPKVGRNDPCPCGSGKKYKKCCGINQ